MRRANKSENKEYYTSSGLGLGFLISGILLFLTGYGSLNRNLNFTIYFIPVPWWAWLAFIYISIAIVFFKMASGKKVSGEDIIGPFI